MQTKKEAEHFERKVKDKKRIKTKGFALLEDLKGILAGTPPFKRDKRDREFGRAKPKRTP